MAKQTKKAAAEPADTSEEPDSKTFNPTLVLVLVTLSIIIVIAGVLLWNKHHQERLADQYTYNYFEFRRDPHDLYWETDVVVNGMLTTVPFWYYPTEVEDIPIDADMGALFTNFPKTGRVYVTLDPDLNGTAVQAGVQISRLTGSRFGILGLDTRSAFTSLPPDVPANASVPFNVVKCQNQSEHTLVVWLTKMDYTAVTHVDNCVRISGTDEQDLVRAADRLGYAILDIMP
ncbi:MAG: hypothetical protein ABIH41_07445 [Nanoarchaeota archaeon]